MRSGNCAAGMAGAKLELPRRLSGFQSDANFSTCRLVTSRTFGIHLTVQWIDVQEPRHPSLNQKYLLSYWMYVNIKKQWCEFRFKTTSKLTWHFESFCIALRCFITRCASTILFCAFLPYMKWQRVWRTRVVIYGPLLVYGTLHVNLLVITSYFKVQWINR